MINQGYKLCPLLASEYLILYEIFLRFTSGSCRNANLQLLFGFAGLWQGIPVGAISFFSLYDGGKEVISNVVLACQPKGLRGKIARRYCFALNKTVVINSIRKP